MSKPLPRTRFNHPPLVRLLTGPAGEDHAASKQAFAEQLGQWLDLSDTIALSGALAGGSPRPAGHRPTTAGALADALARTRKALTDAILGEGPPAPGRTRPRLPPPGSGLTAEGAVDFAPYRRYYAAQQREMEAAIAPLRAQARAALQGGTPGQAQLAALDAVMDKALAERERLTLGAVPFLVERRYARRTDTPAAWLPAFGRELQQALLAELDLRLQPVLGLIEAFSNEVTKQQ